MIVLYPFKIALAGGRAAYTDKPERARRLLADHFGEGTIEQGSFEVERACICHGFYRRSTGPDNMTGHFNNEGFYCCPHTNHSCGRKHGPVFYGPNRGRED